MYDSQNVFARILREEIPAKKIFENEHAFAFHDIAPQAPIHILIIPKGAYISFDDFIEKASKEEITSFFKAVKEVAKIADVQQDGYRLLTNHGKDSHQEVPHFHMHLLAGKPLGPLLAT